MEHLYKKVVNDIKKMIDNEILNEGDKVLSERELAKKYDVSRSVIREAISILRVEGLVSVHAGKGTFITKPDPNIVTETIKRVMQNYKTTIEDVLDVREELEKSIVKKSVYFSSAKDIENLYKMHENMENYRTDLREYIKLDVQFHLAIAKSTKNPLFFILLKSFMEMTNHILFDLTILLNDTVTLAQEQHLSLINAIALRDEQLANKIIVEHMQGIRNEIQDLKDKKYI